MTYRLYEYVFNDTGDFIGDFSSLDEAEGEFSSAFLVTRTSQYDNNRQAHHQITQFEGTWEDGKIKSIWYYYE